MGTNHKRHKGHKGDARLPPLRSLWFLLLISPWNRARPCAARPSVPSRPYPMSLSLDQQSSPDRVGLVPRVGAAAVAVHLLRRGIGSVALVRLSKALQLPPS